MSSRVPIHIGSDFPLVGREYLSLSSFYDLVALLDSSVDATWLSLSMLISIHKLRNEPRLGGNAELDHVPNHRG